MLRFQALKFWMSPSKKNEDRSPCLSKINPDTNWLLLDGQDTRIGAWIALNDALVDAKARDQIQFKHATETPLAQIFPSANNRSRPALLILSSSPSVNRMELCDTPSL